MAKARAYPLMIHCRAAVLARGSVLIAGAAMFTIEPSSRSMTGVDADDRFEFGLSVLIAGLEAANAAEKGGQQEDDHGSRSNILRN
jgi:Tetracyclin repressor-like, C-terminal domain